jgi:hypothetical protein
VGKVSSASKVPVIAEKEEHMSAVLKEGQTLQRVIKVYGIERPVVVSISRNGLTLRVKGSKTEVAASWPIVVNACSTPGGTPSKLQSTPLEVLQDTDRRLTASLLKRLDKEAKGRTQ